MNLVIIQNRQAVTTSLQVAESFEKRHDNVLREIEGLLKNEEAHNYFREGTYEHPQNKQQYRMFYMNRDGFTLLAMGFTGQKAIQFKLAYIQAFNEMERQLMQPTTAELIAMMAQQGVEQERRLNAVEEKQLQLETKQDNIAEIIALNPTEWRKKVTNLINKIALSRGGFEAYRNVRNESYQILEERGRCKLDIRLSNRRKEMALNGITKSKLDKVTKLDVIADDARLTEIYLAVVKEMAIKYSINAEGLGA
ncbi:Rha family transcriptional regulator [Lysinibacillus parviboronicapiens]|uniref:Rha family transcriptional regulator n=1 Tax=Lysinibacillus parviboronicapiens TaxID=436516 RepID=UPI001931014C|nr:Rha family transcriptional regulator [Lysinibacillus parviboronicapiens]